MNAQTFEKPMTFGIALGSNLGDRLAHLQQAVDAIMELAPNVQLVTAAPVFETEPVDCPEGSMSFYNTVVEITASIEPLALLLMLRKIEASLGRPNDHGHHAPRTVDLDILYAGDVLMNHPDLVLPHPRMTQRRFVMEPLACIRPHLILPGQSEDVRLLLSRLDGPDAAIKQVASNWTNQQLSEPNALAATSTNF